MLSGANPAVGNRHRDLGHYRGYQQAIAVRHLIPFFERHEVSLDEGPILDVGCGTGGCVLAISAALSRPAEGIDLDSACIAEARAEAARAKLPVTFRVGDIIDAPRPEAGYGLLLFRDVVEHLPDPRRALQSLRTLVAPDGLLYVTFPPWRGPYAGHQHNAKSFVKFLPYFHAMAPGLFIRLLRRQEPHRVDWLADADQIAKTRMGRRKFERMAAEAGWTIRVRHTYFLRPAFLRMGLPAVPNGLVGRLPVIGECLTTACEYLLAPAPANRV